MAKFKKRKRKDNVVDRIRESTTSTIEEEHDDDEQQNFKQALEEQFLLKTEKRLKKGIIVEAKNTGGEEDDVADIVNTGEATGNLVPTSDTFGVRFNNKMKPSTGSTAVSKLKDLESNPLLQQYIEEKLSGKNADRRVSDAAAKDSLMKNKAKRKMEDESIQGMPVAWSTGIVEVILPEKEKVVNIEKTERARKKMFESQYNKDKGKTGAAGANANLNRFAKNLPESETYGMEKKQGNNNDLMTSNKAHLNNDLLAYQRFSQTDRLYRERLSRQKRK